MPAAERYRRIELAPVAPLGEAADDALAFLNRRFDPDDFYAARNGDALDVWLREADVEALRDAASEAGRLHGSADAMRRIVEAVEGVGSYGINGGKRLYVGYNRERKVAGRKGKEQRRGKHYYANDHAYERDANPFPPEFTDKIVCGDSEEVLKRLPDNCVDLVFTSPPYNFGLGYEEGGGGASGDDAADWEAYFAKLFRVFDECVRVLKFGGRIAVNLQPLFSDYIPSHHVVSNYFMGKRLIWKGEIPAWARPSTPW